MKRHIKIVLLVMALSMLLQVAMAFIRITLGIEASTVIGYFLYYFSYCIITRLIKHQSTGVFISLLIGVLILQLPIRVASFSSTSVTLLEFIFQLLGILSAWLISKSKMIKTQVFWLLASISLVVPASIYGNRLWYSKLTFGSFTGKVLYQDIDILGIDDQGLEFSTKGHLGKTILLDFWHTKCSACFKKFPKLEYLSERYRNDTNVLVIAVNYPLKSDTEDLAYNLIKERNYTFKTIVLQEPDVIKQIQLTYFPTTYIVDKSGDFIFAGDIENAEEFLANQLLLID